MPFPGQPPPYPRPPRRPADSPFPIRLTSLLASQQGCASASICSARDFRWIYGAFFPACSARKGRFPSPCHGPSRSLTHARCVTPRLARPRYAARGTWWPCFLCLMSVHAFHRVCVHQRHACCALHACQIFCAYMAAFSGRFSEACQCNQLTWVPKCI
ncbi:hypothetical protein BJ912DRAFT_995704 [Pholiota molesta]|nr:hypothetical protein BJ912DRAFT_995704 [Pholiota molesta]